MRMLSTLRGGADAQPRPNDTPPPPQPPPPPSNGIAARPTPPFQTWREHNAPPAHTSPAEPWVTALLLVAFDLDKGQIVEACVPRGALTPSEQEAVCGHAMPDSAASGSGPEDALYSFRVPRAATELLLAHTLFRQAADPSSPRGYFQKALVLVTSAPCLALPRAMLVALAAPAFVRGVPALHAALAELAAWPDPRVQTVSRDLAVPFAGVTFAVRLPQSFLRSFAAPSVGAPVCKWLADEPGSPVSVTWCTSFGSGGLDCTEVEPVEHAGARTPELVRHWPLCTPSPSVTAAPFHEVNLAAALQGVTDRIWALWELLALGEPVAILAPTPSQCSAAVLALVGLMHPLPFVGDWRPYLCIQDPLYTRLAAATDVRDVVPNGALLGFTNAHMVERVRFPHVLTIGGAQGVNSTYKSGLKSAHRGALHKSRHVTAALGGALTHLSRKDDALPDQAAHEARACVLDKVTRPFLRAFDRYLAPTWGDGRAVTEEPYASDPFDRPLRLLELDVEAFPTPADVASPGVASVVRGGAASKRARRLYGAFVRGGVFDAWWRGARAAALRECAVLHRTDVMEACVRGTGVVARRGAGGAAYADEGDVTRAAELARRVRAEAEAAGEADRVLRGRLQALFESLVAPLPDEVRRGVVEGAPV